MTAARLRRARPLRRRSLCRRASPPAEIASLTGTFVLTAGDVPSNLHDSYAQYRRTYRVFNENGRLMIEASGQAPERLLKQEDGRFVTRSSARNRISFVIRADRAAAMKMTSQSGLPLSGDRVGDGDPKT